MKHGMVFRSDDDVQITRRATVRAGVALASDANALAIPRTGLDADFERLSAADHAFSVANRAGRDVLARASAARTGHVELHAIGALLDGAFALALRADAWLLDHAVAVAIGAGVLARNVEPHHTAPNRCPEGHVDLIFEIAAGLGAFWRDSACSAPSAEDAGEDVAESSAT